MELDHLLDLHRQATALVQPLHARVRAEHLVRPTPCAGWDLRALLEHVVGQDAGFAAAVTASPGDVGTAAFAAQPLGSDPQATLSAGSRGLLAAFAGADPSARVLLPELGARAFPLKAVVGFHLVDTVVHGWDVAAALGEPYEVRGDLLAAALDQAERVPTGASRQAPGAAFGPDLPAQGAGEWERTLLLLGRDPAWAAGA